MNCSKLRSTLTVRSDQKQVVNRTLHRFRCVLCGDDVAVSVVIQALQKLHPCQVKEMVEIYSPALFHCFLFAEFFSFLETDCTLSQHAKTRRFRFVHLVSIVEEPPSSKTCSSRGSRSGSKEY